MLLRAWFHRSEYSKGQDLETADPGLQWSLALTRLPPFRRESAKEWGTPLQWQCVFHSPPHALCDEQPLLRIWKVQNWEHAPRIFL